jgi:hypothetical protein
MLRMLSEALKSGEYKQANGVLYLVDEFNDQRNCCLGVMECEIGVDFEWRGMSREWVDQFGASVMPSDMVSHYAGFNNAITLEERDYFEEISNECDLRIHEEDEDYSRAEVLAALNDAGLDFTYIAEVLTDLDWDVDLNALANAVWEVEDA